MRRHERRPAGRSRPQAVEQRVDARAQARQHGRDQLGLARGGGELALGRRGRRGRRPRAPAARRRARRPRRPPRPPSSGRLPVDRALRGQAQLRHARRRRRRSRSGPSPAARRPGQRRLELARRAVGLEHVPVRAQHRPRARLVAEQLRLGAEPHAEPRARARRGSSASAGSAGRTAATSRARRAPDRRAPAPRGAAPPCARAPRSRGGRSARARSTPAIRVATASRGSPSTTAR